MLVTTTLKLDILNLKTQPPFLFKGTSSEPNQRSKMGWGSKCEKKIQAICYPNPLRAKLRISDIGYVT